MTNYRSLGPAGLTAFIGDHGGRASPALDAVCAQIDAHTARLYWFTDLDAAIAEATRTAKPILSLRLLGRLDQELSCANSRFFRKLLYPNPQINRLLREQFVLHWESVRPVPLVTIDFGDGRRIERTLTGNSVHVVLDSRGRAVDALPGLFDKPTFLALLEQSLGFAGADRADLARLHSRAHMQPRVIPPPSRAMAASTLAMTKHRVEAPVLRGVAMDVDADTAINLELHARVHKAFARREQWRGVAGLVEWIYATLFAMPLGDASLGLDAPDPFVAQPA